MGSTSAQGWYLFILMVGFTLGPAGLFALGWLVALIGFALIAVALVGFRSTKEPATEESAGVEHRRAAPTVRTGAH
ncbi:MAG: hypothetical protein HYZ72_03140 [Deltaproteobacteria bacterium]|nr:hypothetical protein [Deltaproteobacteria bacterium]